MPQAESGLRTIVAIPAWNEAPRIANVVSACVNAQLGPVWVVDDGSSDGTGEVARGAGAEVLELRSNLGKGGAIASLLQHVDCDVVVLIDADLVGLTPSHVRLLADPVLRGHAPHARGLFRDGRWSTTAAQQIAPQLSGQRAIRKEILAGTRNLAESRFGVETQIERQLKAAKVESVDVYFDGVSQVVKEAKRGLIPGVWARIVMYADIIAAQLKR